MYDEAELDILSSLNHEDAERRRQATDPVFVRLDRIDHNVRDIGRALTVLVVILFIGLLVVFSG